MIKNKDAFYTRPHNGLIDTGDSGIAWGLVEDINNPEIKSEEIVIDPRQYHTYKEVKKDLMGRYPKHYWPDNPFSATPTSRVKPKNQA